MSVCIDGYHGVQNAGAPGVPDGDLLGPGALLCGCIYRRTPKHRKTAVCPGQHLHTAGPEGAEAAPTSVHCRRTSFTLNLIGTIVFFLQGFCLPEEIVAGGDGDGSMNFHDYEGGGIGEGEGTKDISDTIENEDQVMKSLKLTNICCC